MADRIDARTKIAVCKPDNLIGTYWTHQALADFLERVGDTRIVVVDEAYCEYVEAPDFPDTLALMARYPNLLVFRTFSKMYALAGLRIGYLIGSEAVAITRRTSVAYSSMSVRNKLRSRRLPTTQGYIAATRALVKEGKALMRHCCARLGLECIAGEGNCV